MPRAEACDAVLVQAFQANWKGTRVVIRESCYLLIPSDYGAWLGGLHWSSSGDALETEEGETFALTPSLALFLEGFCAQRQPVHFCHVLHLFHLLRRGELTIPAWRIVARGFIPAGKYYRNFGALCSLLCREVPSLAGTIDMEQVCEMLRSGPLPAIFGVHHWTVVESQPVECPALAPEAFEIVVTEALRALTVKEVHHWLKHGSGPEDTAGKQAARVLPLTRPRTLVEVLEALLDRQRLAGAVPFVSQLVSALALPPRRLSRQELPIGGYADVTTRGHPEQILPSQFAVDDLEFVRRYAENELLYFRREEPARQIHEEMVLLLDQGVRTWGTVRLVLSAAVLALGKLAARRKISFLIAGTSSEGKALDPLQTDEETLAGLVEASDLSLHPGLALEHVLEQPATCARDIVLLTHPRNLQEEDVRAAAHRVAPGTRLFALAVDGQGQARLSEVRHGTPVVRNRFQVDLTLKEKPSERPRKPGTGETESFVPWTGAVEPVGFPFRLGITSGIEKFAFDAAGDWLLTVSKNGLLHAWHMKDAHFEILPRGMHEGSVLDEVVEVVGVTGGFVVVGMKMGRLRPLHYSFNERTCILLKLELDARLNWKWYYFPKYHCVVARDHALSYGADLATGESCEGIHAQQCKSDRLKLACSESYEWIVPPPQLHITTDRRWDKLRGPCILFDDQTSTITLYDTKPQLLPFEYFYSDGKPMFKDCVIRQSQLAGSSLAISVQHREKTYSLILLRRHFGTSDFKTTTEFRKNARPPVFALSRDGRRMACQVGDRTVEVSDVVPATARIFVTSKGKHHSNVRAELGKTWLSIQIGKWVHLIRWDRERVEFRNTQGDRQTFLSVQLGAKTAEAGTTSFSFPRDDYLRKRFLVFLTNDVWVGVDRLGQLAVFKRANDLICTFFVFRGQIAARLPDGTRYGPASITGGPETAGALDKIGQALREGYS